MTHDKTDKTDTTIYINKLEIGSVGNGGGSVGARANGAMDDPNARAAAKTRARRWSDDPWSALTTGEAEAWRAGWEEAKAQALKAAAVDIGLLRDLHEEKAAAGASLIAGAIAAMEPPK